MRHSLELLVPPPVVGICLAILVAWLAGAPVWPDWLRLAGAVLCAGLGVGFDALGIWAFRQRRTTVNPLKPENTSALVTHGVYRITRNPMYVGLAWLLLAWAFWLGSPWGLLAPVALVAYLTRFQILPEERVLRAHFGAEFDAYAQRVRRWL